MDGSGARQQAAAGKDPRGPAQTLLVDDVPALRRLYGMLLEAQGPFEVVAEAGDGAEAIDAAEAHTPDLILLDLSMPRMDGLEALPKILEVSPDSTVVVLSGFLEARVGERARGLGADAYLEKGTDPDRLVEQIVDLLGLEASGDTRDGHAPQASAHPPGDELAQFAYTASHDLQEPLRMVASFLELFEDRYGERIDDEGLEMLAYASRGVDRLQAMIEGLLTYSRVETGANPPEPLELEDILEDAIGNLALRIETSGARITHDDLGTIRGDRGQILQVFQNLLENAIKFHHGRPTIHVGAHETADTVEITVEDDGPGIPEDDLGRIFALFERGPSDERANGSGIGLAVSRRIVERHGGSIRVASTVGEGTTFTIELPKEPARAGEGEA